MKSLKTNFQNDIFLTGGHLQVATGADAIAQACEHIAKAVRGEMVFSLDRGMPYEETIFSPRHNIPLFLAHLKKALKKVEGVRSVKVDGDLKNGIFEYSAEILTIEGERRAFNGSL